MIDNVERICPALLERCPHDCSREQTMECEEIYEESQMMTEPKDFARLRGSKEKT